MICDTAMIIMIKMMIIHMKYNYLPISDINKL